MHKTAFLVGARLVLGILTLAAIVVQAQHVQQAGVFVLSNYLSYFTNLSNILAAIVFIASALFLLMGRTPSAAYDVLRGAATLYMAVTGVVYATLLVHEDLGLLLPWVNIVTHVVMPLAVVADWLYQPPRSRLYVRRMVLWLVFPSLYLAYTLVRGAFVQWYPYPFVNPDKVGGYGVVALYCAAIVAAFVGIGWLLVRAAVSLGRRTR